MVVRATRAEHSRRFLRELDEAPGGNNLQYIYYNEIMLGGNGLRSHV